MRAKTELAFCRLRRSAQRLWRSPMLAVCVRPFAELSGGRACAAAVVLRWLQLLCSGRALFLAVVRLKTMHV